MRLSRFTSVMLLALATAGPAAAQGQPYYAHDNHTEYDLLDPSSHAFAIVYFLTERRVGATVVLNQTRSGSAGSDISVFDPVSGEPLEFEYLTGAELTGDGTAEDVHRTRCDVRCPDDAAQQAGAERAPAGCRDADRAGLHRSRWSAGLGAGAAHAAQYDPAADRLRGDDRVGAGHRQHAGRRPGGDSGVRWPSRRGRHDPDPRHEAAVGTWAWAWALGAGRWALGGD